MSIKAIPFRTHVGFNVESNDDLQLRVFFSNLLHVKRSNTTVMRRLLVDNMAVTTGALMTLVTFGLLMNDIAFQASDLSSTEVVLSVSHEASFIMEFEETDFTDDGSNSFG